MNINKKYLILLTIIFVLTAFFIPQESTLAKKTTYNQKHIISQIKNDNICLYYDKKSKGLLRGFYIKSGNKIKYFNWKNIDKASFYPTIQIIDNNYIAIICTTSEGSGVNVKELYLLNKKSLKRLSFVDPVDVVKSNVKFEVQPPNVSIKIGNNIWSGAYKNMSIEKVDYESVVVYDVQSSYFTVKLSAQISPAIFIGDIEINYYFNEKKATFVPKFINFNFYPTEINR